MANSLDLQKINSFKDLNAFEGEFIVFKSNPPFCNVCQLDTHYHVNEDETLEVGLLKKSDPVHSGGSFSLVTIVKPGARCVQEWIDYNFFKTTTNELFVREISWEELINLYDFVSKNLVVGNFMFSESDDNQKLLEILKKHLLNDV